MLQRHLAPSSSHHHPGGKAAQALFANGSHGADINFATPVPAALACVLPESSSGSGSTVDSDDVTADDSAAASQRGRHASDGGAKGSGAGQSRER